MRAAELARTAGDQVALCDALGSLATCRRSANSSPATIAPERSYVQRMQALQRANDIRSRRAQLKRDLKAGRQPIDELLLAPPEYLETAKVFDLLLAVPKYGRVKVNKILQLSARSRRARRSVVCPSASGASSLRSCDGAELQRRRGPVPKVFVITGPSGVGKGTLIRRTRAAPGARAVGLGHDAQAAPWRAGRGGLSLLSPEEIRGSALPPASSSSTPTYSGNRYGTLRSEVERRRRRRRCRCVLEIEVQGARQVRAAMPDAVAVFIAPPSLERCARGCSGGAGRPGEPGRAQRMRDRSGTKLEARPEFAASCRQRPTSSRATDELVATVRTRSPVADQPEPLAKGQRRP